MAAVCSKVSRNIALIRRYRKYLSLDSCQKLVSDLVIATFDYDNALYSGLPIKELINLQGPQNCAAKTIFGRNRYDHSKFARYKWHWLPVEERINFMMYLH